MGLQPSILGQYLLANMAAENNWKPVKHKICVKQKTKRWVLNVEVKKATKQIAREIKNKQKQNKQWTVHKIENW